MRLKRPLDELHLADLIDGAIKNHVISEACGRQAGLAKDARNLIHPGNAVRSGGMCNKTTALTALAAVYRVIDELVYCTAYRGDQKRRCARIRNAPDFKIDIPAIPTLPEGHLAAAA